MSESKRKKSKSKRQNKDHRLGDLPVNAAYDLIVKYCAQHGVVVIIGETGSGKSTQIPQFLMELRTFGGRVAVTQPRRVAAMSLAQRVASERGVSVGSLVGYSVRFDDRTSKATRLRYLTDGMLLREAMVNPLLMQYSVIVIDEAHERSLSTDVLLGIVKTAQNRRRETNMPLRVVIMSATVDADIFVRYFLRTTDETKQMEDFYKPAILYIEGRQHRVDLFYADEAQNDYVDAAIVTILQIHMDETSSGDILCFLTGQEEIEMCIEILEERAQRLPSDAMKLQVFPIFAALPLKEQVKALKAASPGVRKVILATNIAETSITIPGVRFVVDPGMFKSKSYSSSTGMDMLKVGPISQDQAWQRTGRAGREGPGKCFRLFREADFKNLAPKTSPEIERTELTGVVLQLLTMGIRDVCTFDFISPPSQEALQKALFVLLALDAVEMAKVENETPNSDVKQGRLPALTELGKRMAALPIEPIHGKFLLESLSMECVEEALTVVAMMSVDSPTYCPRSATAEAKQMHARFMSYDSDHLTLLNIYQAFIESGQDYSWSKANFLKHNTMLQAVKVRRQLAEMMVKVCPTLATGMAFSTCGSDQETLLKCLVKACSLRVAQKLPKENMAGVRYRTVMESIEARIHPSSCVFKRNPMPDWIIFNELILTSKKYIRCVAAIDQKWLPELAPKLFSVKSTKRLCADESPAPSAKRLANAVKVDGVQTDNFMCEKKTNG